MARYYEEEALIEALKSELLKHFSDSYVYSAINLFRKVLDNAPTTNITPKSETSNALLDLKRQVHDKAVYPYGYGFRSYITLREFDAILNNILMKYSEEKK